MGQVGAAVARQRPSNPLSGEERPWGRFTVLEVGDGYQVKRLEVTPGHRLSLQFHHHRSEHWIVVSGTARLVIGSETRVAQPRDTAFVPREARHRIENPGPEPLVIIEVQHGAYLGEDDIVRIEDDYARVEPADSR